MIQVREGKTHQEGVYVKTRSTRQDNDLQGPQSVQPNSWKMQFTCNSQQMLQQPLHKATHSPSFVRKG